MPAISGPAVATSPTGNQLAIGPPGPRGAQGAPGAKGDPGPPGPNAGGTAKLVLSGQNYTLQPTDTVVIFDTSGGSPGSATMIAPSYVGQRWTFYWWSWDPATVDASKPVIYAPPGMKIVPFGGQTAPGNAGLASSTEIRTPGASYGVVWDSQEITVGGLEGGGLQPVSPGWIDADASTPGGVLQLDNSQTGSAVRTDTTGGTLTKVLLPSGPTDGIEFDILDATGQWPTHNLTLDGNGTPIVNPAEVGGTGATAGTVTLSEMRACVTVKYDANHTLWQVGGRT